ncbi:MAG: hypothetical protein FWF96_04065, partial [Kiritimatiellaeota bacterium]|nr:hypothetical protein [Kiritimatiellota bacterium]
YVGKLVFAMAALADCDSLAQFKQSEYYPVLMDYETEYNPDKETFSMQLGTEQKLKAAKTCLAIIGVITALVIVFKICRCKRKRSKMA